ncbi:hypothetical protein [Nannocystis sp. SCPEA4]|uniref:hypothetical protein n=1 Tax=Nannocystis sp. SCPEA4 TaxID=2996787 RepID=UPI002270020F|nr:hypothetical protein [Nannocystis sp. SCPEA4]MCY1057225.1 hypothetical protein [Nannocystis sp. SCPEA4]
MDEDIRSPPPVLNAAAKFAITSVWFLVASVPSVLLDLYDIQLTAGWGIAPPDFFVLPFFWCVCVGLTAPLYVRMLGHTREVPALPPPARVLHHLPPACARLVASAAAIRQDIGDVEAALHRAWELANEVDKAPPDVRLALESAGATLHPVRGLIATHAESKRPRKLRVILRASLATALADFESALTQPRSGGFR